MPGINITTSVRTGPTNTTVRESSQAFFVGFAQRGPIDEAVKVTSLEEFERTFGGFVSTYNLHPTVEAFFEEGGSQCYVARIGAASSGTTASTTLNRVKVTTHGVRTSNVATLTFAAAHGFAVGDVVAVTGFDASDSASEPLSGLNNATATITAVTSTTISYASTGNNILSTADVGTVTAGSLTLTANGFGAAGNDLSVTVIAGTIDNSSNIIIEYGGTELMRTGNVTTAEQAIGKINSHIIAKHYVVAAADGDTDAAPTAAAEASFSGGANGTDGGSTQVSTALDLFVNSLGTGAVACPEFHSSQSALGAVPTALVAHAVDTNRVAVLHTDSGLTTANAQDAAELATSTLTEGAERACMSYPWVYAPTATAGVTRLIPPDGYVCGVRARAHNTTGQHQPGAGIYSTARFIAGLEREVGKTTADALDTACMNVIRIINNSIRLYGARSLSSDTENWRYLNAMEVVNYVVVEAERALEDLLFSTIDGRNKVFADVQARLTGLLEPLRVQGALYEAFDTNGKRIDHGYTIKCDTTLNPTTNLKDGIVTARVGLRPAGVTDTIEVDIVKSNLTASVV